MTTTTMILVAIITLVLGILARVLVNTAQDFFKRGKKDD